MITIAHIHNDFNSKFGVPRQSGLTASVSRIVFEKEFRQRESLRGLEDFTHIWLLWHFHMAADGGYRSTVRPPRLGGNRRMGVFATRSPFRPNNIGLSCVRIVRLDMDTADGPVIWVEGADLMDGTPIIDIKPYLPFTDSHPEASAGWTDQVKAAPLQVSISQEARQHYPLDQAQWKSLVEILSQDPRPHYQDDAERIYTMEYANCEIRFKVQGHTAIIIHNG